MNTVRITWRGPQLTAQLKAAVQEALDESIQRVVAEAKELVSEPYPPASSPGNPPHKRTGRGQEAIGWTSLPRKLEAYLTVALEGFHMVFLDLGTRHIAPRPWVRPAFQRSQKAARDVTLARLQRIFQ